MRALIPPLGSTVGALAGMLFLLPSPIRTLRDVPEEALE
jgi:hypothetical protein